MKVIKLIVFLNTCIFIHTLNHIQKYEYIIIEYFSQVRHSYYTSITKYRTLIFIIYVLKNVNLKYNSKLFIHMLYILKL